MTTDPIHDPPTASRPDDKPPRSEALSWWSPDVAGIGTASFLADIGHEIPTALLPSLLTSTLGAPASVLRLSRTGEHPSVLVDHRFVLGPRRPQSPGRLDKLACSLVTHAP